jgi:hypothetical protein
MQLERSCKVSAAEVTVYPFDIFLKNSAAAVPFDQLVMPRIFLVLENTDQL